MAGFKDLKTRVFVSSILILWAFSLLYFCRLSFMPPIVALSMTGIAALGLWEFAFLCKKKKLFPNKLVMILSGFFVILIFYFSIHHRLVDDALAGFLFLVVIVSTIIRYKTIPNSIANVGAELLGLVYIAIPLAMILKILYSLFQGLDGRFWIAYLILVTKTTDIGAYFGGRLLGKTPLCPTLSPKKTVEGALSGLLLSIIVSVLFFYLVFSYLDTGFSYSLPIYLGAFLSAAGQFGDLSESLFKRDAGVKDSNTLPGLGGVLDVFDSLFFTAPILYFYLHCF